MTMRQAPDLTTILLVVILTFSVLTFYLAFTDDEPQTVVEQQDVSINAAVATPSPAP